MQTTLQMMDLRIPWRGTAGVLGGVVLEWRTLDSVRLPDTLSISYMESERPNGGKTA
jgi:hypothetical protein